MEYLEPLAEQFFEIFRGNDRGHGEFRITDVKGKKAKGKAKTIAEPATLEDWEKHLLGEVGLGIVPITESSTCSWGCVDVDEYEDLDLEDLSFKLPKPFVLCRSKSGGAHIFLFTQTPTSPALVRKKLTLVARALGQPNAEIFPKQDKLGEGDIGNWLNMPYFKAESTMRYCIRAGVSLTVEEFISYALDCAISQEDLVSLNVDPIIDEEVDEEFADAPPCIQYLVKHGVPPGQRNSALFSFGVFARKKFPNDWENRIFEYNQRFMGPGTYTEVSGVIRSLSKRSYFYKCKDQPLIHLCDRETCSTMEHGVPLAREEERAKRPCILDQVETPIKCYAPTEGSHDEPYWVFTIDGRSLDVTVDMARSQTFFAKGYLKQFHRVLLPVKDNKWVDLMNELLASAEIHELAPDAGPEGQFKVHLEEFCTGKGKARSREEILLGKPWDDSGRTYFRSSDLMKYLDQQRFRAFRETEIFAILKRQGSKHHSFNIKGKHVSCWSIEAFTEQDEPFENEAMNDDSAF